MQILFSCFISFDCNFRKNIYRHVLAFSVLAFSAPPNFVVFDVEIHQIDFFRLVGF